MGERGFRAALPRARERPDMAEVQLPHAGVARTRRPWMADVVGPELDA
jgi:hypothetical protein